LTFCVETQSAGTFILADVTCSSVRFTEHTEVTSNDHLISDEEWTVVVTEPVDEST